MNFGNIFHLKNGCSAVVIDRMENGMVKCAVRQSFTGEDWNIDFMWYRPDGTCIDGGDDFDMILPK